MELYLCSRHTYCMGPSGLLIARAVRVPVVIIHGVTIQVCGLKLIAV
jgi:hypothetical protein